MCSYRGKASGSRHVDPVDSEQVEEHLRAKRLAAKARREERVGRWARALVERLALFGKGSDQVLGYIRGLPSLYLISTRIIDIDGN